MTGTLASRFELLDDHWQRPAIYLFVTHFFEWEGLFALPEIDWTTRRSVSEWWELREGLLAQKALGQSWTPSLMACPALLNEQVDGDDIRFDVLAISNLSDPKTMTEAILRAGLSNESLARRSCPTSRAVWNGT